MTQEMFHTRLKKIMNEYVHIVYALTRHFPNEELYGVTSQIRRAALSVILNYIEGYARVQEKVHKNFLLISYGSLQESHYLLEFSRDEHYLPEEDFTKAKKNSLMISEPCYGVLLRR